MLAAYGISSEVSMSSFIWFLYKPHAYIRDLDKLNFLSYMKPYIVVSLSIVFLNFHYGICGHNLFIKFIS